MDNPFYLSLPHESTAEAPVTLVQREKFAFAYRYAYARSMDSREANEIGQDYLVVLEDSQRLAFALCDGVSQSFFGDLAAGLAAESLLKWIWQQATNFISIDDFNSGLIEMLQTLTGPGTKIITQYKLPESLPPILQSVLEEKRAIGSQTTFVTGLMDVASKQLLLAWMGDSRLRLWNESGREITNQLGDTFRTTERWSTCEGLIGNLHTCLLPLLSISCLVTYSDGLAGVDKVSILELSNQVIQENITAEEESPTSDDISFLQVWLGIPPIKEALILPPQNIQDTKLSTAAEEGEETEIIT